MDSLRALTRAAAVAVAVSLTAGTATAASISYTATPLGGTSWRYDYTVDNSAPSIGFDQFTIYFDPGLYSGLAGPTAPTDWDPIAIEPDPGIPDDGFFDALNMGAPLAGGQSLGGFSVTFNWLGAGAPGAQPFDLLDSFSLRVVASGRTGSPNIRPMPVPGSVFLSGLGLGLLFVSRRVSRTLY